jgi:hypothetical protein
VTKLTPEQDLIVKMLATLHAIGRSFHPATDALAFHRIYSRRAERLLGKQKWDEHVTHGK